MLLFEQMLLLITHLFMTRLKLIRNSEQEGIDMAIKVEYIYIKVGVGNYVYKDIIPSAY